jgi:hypothetical protein
MNAEVAYLVINYTAEVGQQQYEDFGPVLVQTRSFLHFYPVGTYTAMPLPILGYELLRAYPPGTTEDEAVQRFSAEFALAERTV